jgi:hypothetical protein
MAYLALAGVLASSPEAQMVGLKWERDTIVEKEYQPSFCQNKLEKTSICSDAFSLTQLGSQKVVIDSILFKVTTPGIISSHATLKFDQTILKFAYHYSGNQTGYPWKFSEYNDSGFDKISINPSQKVDFSGFEIDNCLFSCPLSQSATSAKLPITAVLIFVSKNQRDTLVLMGLQSQDATHINRYPKSGAKKFSPDKSLEYRNTNGRLVKAPYSQESSGPKITFPCSTKR